MKSLSVIVLAYDVAKDLPLTYQSVIKALNQARIVDYQIILATSDRPDGTNDGTPTVANTIASENPGIIRYHGCYTNRAEAFIQGLKSARKDFVTWIPGDNVIAEESLAVIFDHVGLADVIIGYTVNGHIRPLRRRCLSWCLIRSCNLLFGLNVKYYSGVCIFPRRVLQNTPLSPDAIGFMVEAVVRLLKSGATYIQVPQQINPTVGSSIGNYKSIFSGLRVVLNLFREIQIRF